MVETNDNTTPKAGSPQRVRKPRTTTQSQVVSFRIPQKEFAKLAQEAKAQQRTPSDVARDRFRDAQRMAQVQEQLMELQNAIHTLRVQTLQGLEETKTAMLTEYMHTITEQAIGAQVEKTLVALLKVVHSKGRPAVPASMQQGAKHET